MTQLFKNNAQGALVAELSESGTLVMLAAGHGARFPAPMNGDHFLATLVGLNANGQEDAWEIVKCTGRATDGLTIVRAQEGTTARTWPIGTRFEMRVTAGTLDGFTTTEQAGQAAPVQSVAGKKGAVTLAKADVGLDKVDNTADADKPVSKAVQQALAGKEAAGAAAAAVTAHAQAPDPHPQYQTKLENGVTIKTVNGKSLLGEGNVVIASGGVTLDGDATGFIREDKTYTITNYNAFSQYAVRVSAGQASMQGDKIKLKLPDTAGNVTLIVSVDGADAEFVVRVKLAGVYTPRGTELDALIETPAVVLTASAFVPAGAPDTHASSDWQLASDADFGTVVQSLDASTSSLTSWAVAGLQPGQTYYWRVRYRGAQNGESDWSAPMMLRMASEFLGLIGEPGTQGFGVGVYPGELPEGFAEMEGTRNKANDNYGNYTYKDGSVMVFVPKFYYRFSHASSPRFAKYKMHAIDIAGADAFGNEAAANAAGYVLHRAFKDGGQIKPGFFIDKYPAGFNENRTGVVSKKGLSPISSNDTNCTTVMNNLTRPGSDKPSSSYSAAQFVWAARTRGVGTFHLPSIFMYTAIGFLSLAHRQTCTSTENCAWYHETHNFPKGPNPARGNKDATDSSLSFQNGERYYHVNAWHYKALTGSANVFAKTTHNGQNNGVAEITGSLGEIALGITTELSSLGQSGYLSGAATEVGYVLKDSVSLASLTPDHGGASSVWHSGATIGTLYDRVLGGHIVSTTNRTTPVNMDTAVFSNAQSGDEYAATSCGYANKNTGLYVSLYRSVYQLLSYNYGLLPFIIQNGDNYTGLFVRAAGGTDSQSFKVSSFRCATFGA